MSHPLLSKNKRNLIIELGIIKAKNPNINFGTILASIVDQVGSTNNLRLVSDEDLLDLIKEKRDDNFFTRTSQEH